jgi:hypothetical protein
MKLRLLICTVLLALFAVPAFADTISFTNQGGALSASSSGISLSDSVITTFSFNGNLIASGNLGSLSFDTGSLSGGTFTGGSFSFTSVFANNFTGTLTSLGKGLYDLVGTFSGISNGFAFTGSTDQILSFSGDDSGRDDGKGCWRDLHGTTTITATAAVPEPSTLTFFGTGLIALAGAVRRKLAGRV